MKRINPSSVKAAGARQRGLLARACGLSFSEWANLATATVALLRARIVIILVPANKVIKKLRAEAVGAVSADTPGECSEWLLRTSWAVQSAAVHLPWRTDCLVRVIAADWLVRRKGLQSEVFVSAGKTLDAKFTAHAWLSCQGVEMTGGANPELGTLIKPRDSSKS